MYKQLAKDWCPILLSLVAVNDNAVVTDGLADECVRKRVFEEGVRSTGGVIVEKESVASMFREGRCVSGARVLLVVARDSGDAVQ